MPFNFLCFRPEPEDKSEHEHPDPGSEREWEILALPHPFRTLAATDRNHLITAHWTPGKRSFLCSTEGLSPLVHTQGLDYLSTHRKGFREKSSH